MSAQTNLIRAALEYGQEARPRSPLFNRALAALSELEAQTPIDWKGIKVTKGQETHPLGTLIELLEHERDTAIAELEAHSSEPRLTVDQIMSDDDPYNIIVAIDELLKLKDISMRKRIGTATIEEWEYYKLQCEAIWIHIRECRDRLTKAAQP